ncbi:Toll-Interleukin receptor domain protein [Candidatus Magnetomorum sp. HK-1]|nr:Toll-Interleukin receptor domain protein [Candidatus Magnetomorum sp. HK-1]
MSKIYEKPLRRFENSGLVIPNQSFHVYLENVTNTANENIRAMVDRGRYFTIFAPRQSGKTTFFYDFCRSIEGDPFYITILLSFQTCKKLSETEFYEKMNKDIQSQLLERLKTIKCKEFEAVEQCMHARPIFNHISFYTFFENLNKIITHKKIAIFIDEFDGIPMSELENFLMVLRDLYQNYKNTQKKALYSVGLVGIRNITKLVVGGVSPFNIADQVNLPMFSIKNVRDLFAQYTIETNQPFTEEAVQKIYFETCGQPWLVNRLGTILTSNIKPNTSDSINETDVNASIKLLLKENNVHFDNLYEKILLYKKTFLMILNQDIDYSPNDKAHAWLKQYGLIKELNDKAVISNPIYKKRFLDISKQTSLTIDNKQKQIFICYSHEDKKWLELLVSHLKVLEYEGIQCWYDKNIQTGENWDPKIVDAIEQSQMSICLISTQFLSSDYIRKREIPEILLKQEQGMIVFPILVENCTWKRITWLKNLQMNAKDGLPLAKYREEEQKEILIDIVDEIGCVLGNAWG